MSTEETSGDYEVKVPDTWTVADGEVYATLSPNLTIRVVWEPESQEDPAGFHADLYDEGHLLSTACWEWDTPNVAEFIQVVSPRDTLSRLANIIHDEEREEEESSPSHLEHSPLEDADGDEAREEESSRWERLKPGLAKAWALTTVVILWVADRLIDLMLLVQVGQRRYPPTKRIAWPKGLKEQLMRRQRRICAYCGRRFTSHFLEIDHMTPVALGGSNEISNLQVLCRPCNGRKGDQTDAEYRRRYAGLVPSRRLTPPSRAVAQSKFDAVTRTTRASMALQQRRRLRFITAREKISTGSLVCGVVALVVVYWGLQGLGLEGAFGVYPAAIVGIAVGAGLWLRARTTGALYM